MNDEIVKALRTDVLMVTMDGGDNAVLRAIKRHMTDAANRIESLQAQLTASQRETRAAVEDLHWMRMKVKRK